MKASELIQELQKAVEEHGDDLNIMPCFWHDGRDRGVIAESVKISGDDGFLVLEFEDI